MLSHHKEVYDALQREFPDADVYMGTSDKVEGTKSPFTIDDKKKIAQAHGIDEINVLLAKRPYHKDDYSKYFDEENTHIFFAVGEKDLDRFPFSNVDEETGLDMTVRGEPKPKYYQKINTYKQDPQPMSMRGYITIAPTVQTGGEVASASAFRSALQNAQDEEKAKEIYTKQFGEFDQAVFDLIYKKIKGSVMNENMNIMRKLAGLSEAPVEFDTVANAKEASFLDPGKSSSKMSIANRFPADVDPNDPEVKKEQFINSLMKSPASLLGEISERLDPKDPNNEAIGKRLDDIINKLSTVDNIGGLDNDDKMFVVDVVKVAIKDMSLVAGDDSDPYDDMIDDEPKVGDDEMVPVFDPQEESVDLSDIRGEYGIEEGDLEEGKMKDIIMDLKDMSKEKFCSTYPEHADQYENLCKQYDDDAQNEGMGGTHDFNKYKNSGFGGQVLEVKPDGENPVTAIVTHFEDIDGSFHAEIQDSDYQVHIKQNGQVTSATADEYFKGTVVSTDKLAELFSRIDPEDIKEFQTNEAEAEAKTKVGTMALFVQDQDGGDHEVEVEVEIKNGKPEIVANTLPGPEDMLYWNDADIQQQARDAMDGGDIKFDEDTNEELDRIKSLAGIEEADEDLDNDAVRELELYAENDSSLYQQSYTPIAKNLSKKFKKGNYDSELAKKLWKYHADRAAAQYGEDLLSGRKAGLIMFNPNTRRALASELEDSWHDEMKAGNFMESSEIDEGKEIDCPCCNGGKGKCSHGKEVCGTCKGTGKVEESTNSESVEEAVVSTTANALDAAILELKKLAGLNS